MQGQLTSRGHVKQMHNFFGTYDLEKESKSEHPKTLVCRDLINYRRISATESVPFQFTLTVSLLKSVESGRHFKIWQSVMSNERDLTEDDILHATIRNQNYGPHQVQPPPSVLSQPQPVLPEEALAWGSCFGCVGQAATQVRTDVLDCLARTGSHTRLESPWSISVTA